MTERIIPSQANWLARAANKPTVKFSKKIIFRLLSKLQTGQIIVHDSNNIFSFGKVVGDFPDPAVITIRNPKTYTSVTFGGSIGAGEAYMFGWWVVDDLTALVRIILRNQTVFRKLDLGLATLASPLYKAFHFLRRNSLTGSRKNIHAHYDLGNDFYRLFLDDTMTYSSGYFRHSDVTLKEASISKYDRICRKLQLSEKDHVLEIGTGWGGFALHAVTHYGCRMTTTTLSEAQYALARRRFEMAGIQDQVTLLQADYRDLDGQYDKIVSIEMIEAVGHQYLETFMGQCASLLASDGVMLIQAITIADWAFEAHKRDVDFIKRYIFPGGCIPSVTSISNAMANASDLRPYHLEDITPHYAETLRRWRKNFMDNINRITALGFSDVFTRMWLYYLQYCEAGFEERYLGSVQMVLTKPLARMPVAGWPNLERG